MPRKRLLLVGGAHSDIPLIRAAHRLGFHVTTSGNRRADLGHAEADDYAPCDYSNPEEVLDLARHLRIDAICASSNDFSAISCAYAANILGLPGHDDPDVSRTLHHKDLWRAYATRNAIPSPRAIGCQTLEEIDVATQTLRYPLMIKPVDLTGGKGITKVQDSLSAKQAAITALRYSKARRVVIEEFVEGSRHGFTAILRERKVVFYMMDDEYYHLSPYLVSAAGTPSSAPAAATRRLLEISEAIADSLFLVNGIFHVQFIQPNRGDPVIIEICRRAPGDLYIDLVRHATAAPFASWIVAASTGEAIHDVRELPVSRFILRHCLMAHNVGTFGRFDFDQDMASRIIDGLLWGRAGDVVSEPERQKFGIVFLEFPDRESLSRQAVHMSRLLRVEVV